MGVARSTLQYRSQRQDDEELRLEMIRLAKKYGRYGYRMITELLNTAGWKVNHKNSPTTSGASTSFTTGSAMADPTRC